MFCPVSAAGAQSCVFLPLLVRHYPSQARRAESDFKDGLPRIPPTPGGHHEGSWGGAPAARPPPQELFQCVGHGVVNSLPKPAQARLASIARRMQHRGATHSQAKAHLPISALPPPPR